MIDTKRLASTLLDTIRGWVEPAIRELQAVVMEQKKRIADLESRQKRLDDEIEGMRKRIHEHTHG